MTVMHDLVMRTRSVRRFKEASAISMDTLEYLVNLARCTASGGNKQPLKYALCCDKEQNAVVFSRLAWAGYFKDWPGPVEGERPAAYIVICTDKIISEQVDCDHGIAAQTIALAAMEKGIGCCILASVQREKLMRDFNLGEDLRILLVLALGEPVEECVLEPLGEDGSIKYYRDEAGVHHVPKRSLEEIVVSRHG